MGDPGRAPSASGPVRSRSATPPARPQAVAGCACPAAPAGHGPCGPDPPGPQRPGGPGLRRPGSWVAAGPDSGVGVGRWGWEPVADRLARRFQVITIDNRGIGASDTPPGHYSTRMMADDVLAVLDDAGIQQASVVGTSLGGMIAQELALAHPERVDKLVLVATIPGGPRSRPMPLGTTYLFACGAAHDQQGQAARVRPHDPRPETLRRRPKVARRLAARKLAHPQSQQAWRAQTAAGMLFNPLGRQRRITQPTLVVQGTADQVVDPGNAERAGRPASECPGATVRRGGPPALLGAAQAVRARGDRLPHRPCHSSARASRSRPPGQLAAGRWATAWRCPGLEPGRPPARLLNALNTSGPPKVGGSRWWRCQRSAGGCRLGSCQGGREPLAAYARRQGVVRPQRAE